MRKASRKVIKLTSLLKRINNSQEAKKSGNPQTIATIGDKPQNWKKGNPATTI